VALDVLGWCHRHGELHLTLVLPDGTRSLIPAAWTNLPESDSSSPKTKRSQPATLAACSDLLHARTIVDALKRQTKAANSPAQQTTQEINHAAIELSS